MIFNLFVLLSCLLLVQARARTLIASKVVGGQVVTDHYGFMASLQTLNGRHFCGGSLIHPKWILTAGHCIDEGLPERIQIGEKKIAPKNENGHITSALQGILHPSFDHGPFVLENDIALIELEEPCFNCDYLNFSKGVQSLNTLLTAMGWGAIHEDGPLSSELLSVQVPYVSIDKCMSYYGSNVNQQYHFCAGYHSGGFDTCSGDSGGPILDQEGLILGVTSWGDGCARGNGAYGVYSKIDSTFIRDYVDVDAQYVVLPKDKTEIEDLSTIVYYLLGFIIFVITITLCVY